MVRTRPRSLLLRNRHMVFQHGPQAPNPGEESRTPRLYCMKYQQRNQIKFVKYFSGRSSAVHDKTVTTLTNSRLIVIKSSALYKKLTTTVLFFNNLRRKYIII